MSNESDLFLSCEMETDKSSASTLHEISIVAEDMTDQMESNVEFSQPSPNSVPESIPPESNELSHNNSNEVPVLPVAADSSVHDSGSVTVTESSSETINDVSNINSIILDQSQSIEPESSTVIAPTSKEPECPEPVAQSAHVVDSSSSVLPVSSTVEQPNKENDTNNSPATTSPPITKSAAQPRSSIMSSEEDDDPPGGDPDADSSDRTQTLQKRVSELEALVEQQSADIDTLQSRMTRQDAEARKYIATLQSEHRARAEHQQRVCEELRAEKDAMVMKYAVSEQRAIELTQRAERAERTAKDAARERDAAAQRAKAAKTDADKVFALLVFPFPPFRWLTRIISSSYVKYVKLSISPLAAGSLLVRATGTHPHPHRHQHHEFHS